MAWAIEHEHSGRTVALRHTDGRYAKFSTLDMAGFRRRLPKDPLDAMAWMIFMGLKPYETGGCQWDELQIETRLAIEAVQSAPDRPPIDT